MPSANHMGELLATCGYADSGIVDEDEEFYAEARPL
jgi:hypothetical protein